MDDPNIISFINYLEAEKNASEHTINSYLIDINQFCKSKWQHKQPPYRWKDVDRYDAREKIIEELKNLNLLVKIEKQNMVVPFGDRSGVVIEPWLTDQWFCDAKKMSKEPIKAVKNNETKFLGKKGVSAATVTI